MPAPGEPDYRYHNCNLQAPYMKCKKMTMDSFTVNHWEPSGICTYNGYRGMGTVHTFTETDFECMGETDMAGEFTMYVRSSAGYSGVVLLVITKANDVFSYRDFYQALGNLNGVLVSSSPPHSVSFTITFADPVEVRWIFRGY